MAEVKKVLITLPEYLLSKAENIASMDKITLDDFIQVALEHYINEKNNNKLREQLIKCYQEMGELNLKIAEEFLFSDNEALLLYESESK